MPRKKVEESQMSMTEALMKLCEEKHIDPAYLIGRLEQSLAKSYADVLHLDYGAQVTMDRAQGKIYVYKRVPKGEPDPETGEYTEFDLENVTPKDTSRIAAIHAKREIAEIVRNSAREQIYREFSDRIGDIITGVVLESKPDYTVIKIRDGVEAELPHFNLEKHPQERNECPPRERYSHNQRIRAIIIDVRDPNETSVGKDGQRQANQISPARPTIVVSRTNKELIRRLFELEVPEVYEGVVEIRSIARIPGVRSKVAVSSYDSRLDPVGACVGPKGSRVRNVVSELHGERVDVVPWSDDPAERVAAAVSPARVLRVLVNPETNHATVVVPDDQTKLAIGTKGMNAKLAALLTGMRVDIKNEELMAKVMRDINFDEPEEDEDAEGGRRCAFVGPNGQCRNSARPGSRYCGIHQKLAEMDDVEVSDDPTMIV